MASPYSTTAQVLNRALTTLVTSAKWDVTEVTGDVAKRIAEGDRIIDAKLAGLEMSLPFATNPPLLQDLSVNYARFACFLDLYSAGDPTKPNPQAKYYEDKFNAMIDDLYTGRAKLLDSTGSLIPSTKYATKTVAYPSCGDKSQDQYPNYPNGPFPDPPGVCE